MLPGAEHPHCHEVGLLFTRRMFTFKIQLKRFSMFILKTDGIPVGRGARHEPGCVMLLPWDHQPLRFRLIPHIQEIRGPDSK